LFEYWQPSRDRGGGIAEVTFVCAEVHRHDYTRLCCVANTGAVYVVACRDAGSDLCVCPLHRRFHHSMYTLLEKLAGHFFFSMDIIITLY
jgi:hypothetical protein